MGDFSVQLDAQSQDVYFFYSLYLRSPSAQGVGVARLAWADRDEPGGKIMIWRNGAWCPSTQTGEQRWIDLSASPIFPAAESWHDDDREGTSQHLLHFIKSTEEHNRSGLFTKRPFFV